MNIYKVANSGKDEFYTPEYAVEPILKYVKQNSTIWCPFDTKESNFVKMLSKEGHRVIYTHKNYYEDFFEITRDCDYIISNPPYSLKGQVLSRLFSLGIPFAMLVSVVGVFESQERFQMFKANDFEVMYLNKRVAYFKDFSEQKPLPSPPFLSVYVCSHMLPKQIVFEEIKK